jgi:hypothetical protein
VCIGSIREVKPKRNVLFHSICCMSNASFENCEQYTVCNRKDSIHGFSFTLSYDCSVTFSLLVLVCNVAFACS